MTVNRTGCYIIPITRSDEAFVGLGKEAGHLSPGPPQLCVHHQMDGFVDGFVGVTFSLAAAVDELDLVVGVRMFSSSNTASTEAEVEFPAGDQSRQDM